MSRALAACLAATLSLGACAEIERMASGSVPAQPEVAAPVPRTPGGTSPGAFDTSSARERAAATAQAGSGTRLGTAVVSLGDPTEPGFWLETPLVETVGDGRVETATGESVAVDLRPLPPDATGGSRLSLPAFRLLGLPLTGLPEIAVYAD